MPHRRLRKAARSRHAVGSSQGHGSQQWTCCGTGGLLGGIAVLLGTLGFQWLWTKVSGGSSVQGSSSQHIMSGPLTLGSAGRSASTNSNTVQGSSHSASQRNPNAGTSICSDESDSNLQDSVDRAVGRALEKWTGA